MPGKVRVKILAGRNLPVMDRSSDTTDAYVEIKLSNVTYKTDVYRKSLNPQWNSDWYRFEVDDAELQDEPLQIRLMDHDTYSANDAIGKVNISLNPLLLPNSSNDLSQAGKGSVMSGWIPVFDTMHGIRGEVNLIVKVDLFSDVNKFRQSSCGVQFFHSAIIPHGFRAQIIHGFVEELVVNDDPEYQWIDKIRTPRASNEARQVVFLKLSGQVQRKIGLKAIDLGANAVIGYTQSFDLEGDVGVVARGIGTAVTLIKIQELTGANTVYAENHALVEESDQDVTARIAAQGHIRADSVGCKSTNSPKVGQMSSSAKEIAINRRSSDSDLSITPKGSSYTAPTPLDRNPINTPTAFGVRFKTAPNPENLEMLEYPFLTMSTYPPGFVLSLGATVAARSVKLLERVPNPDEPETRDSWWTELRMEIRSHARSLGCNVVLGYSEVTSISDEVCVLSATGTAAVINTQYMTGDVPNVDTTNSFIKAIQKEDRPMEPISIESQTPQKDGTATPAKSIILVNPSNPVPISCSLCHIPYNQSSIPFSVHMKRCAICKIGKVPDVLLATIELPESLQMTGRGCLIQAQVFRPKKDLRSESNAKEISDGLPFLEYELHRQLINKLKAKGMNAIFGLKATVSIGEKMMALIATGTGLFLSALPPPLVPKIVPGNSWNDAEKLQDLQQQLRESVERNREIYQLKSELVLNGKLQQSDTEGSDDEAAVDMDLNIGNKDTCVLEVDDLEDLEIISLLMEPSPPEGFHVVNTQNVPGLQDLEVVRNLQMFTQVWRAKFPVNTPQNTSSFPKHFQRLLQTIFFKLRRMVPCAISDLKFQLNLPESEEIQLLVTGMVLGLAESNTKIPKFIQKRRQMKKDEELIFNLEETESTSGNEQKDNSNTSSPMNQSSESNPGLLVQHGSLKLRNRSPNRARFNSMRFSRHAPIRERYGVDISPLTFVPGGKIEKYLGNLNFFFIRESTSIRENGGISGFVHSFITELLAVVRAHVSALGGNAMVSFYMTELLLVDNPHKNQGQCLVSVGGDVVFVSYFHDD